MLGAIVAFLFAALLLVYIVRLVFGRRIRAPGARNRPRRLDIVDVFDLDKERQLVIVRRDNTEHLLLIGGPNDVLVESAINRVEGLAGRPDGSRTDVPRPVTPANWPAGPITDEEPAPAPIKPTAPSGINLPPEMIAPKPPAPKPAPPPRPAAPPTVGEPSAPPPPPAPAPATTLQQPTRPAPAPPPPPRPAAPQRPAPPPFLARTQQIIKPRADEGDAPVSEATKVAPPPLPPRPVAPPPLRPTAPPPPRPAVPPTSDATPPAGEPPKGVAPPPPLRPGAPPQRPAPPPPPAPPAPAKGQSTDALESLEEEMARLLGRPEKE